MTEAELRPRTPLVVLLLVGAIVGAYGLYLLQPGRTQIGLAVEFALIPERFNPDSPLRYSHWYNAVAALFGHSFLHLAWWHAGLNAFFLFLTSRLPALRLGAWRFLAVYFASVVVGGILFVALNWNEEISAVGASGGVCGMFSAYFLSTRPTWRDAVSDPRVRGPFGMLFFINVVLMGVAAETGVFPIAWEGHLGGFIGGALAYIAFAPRQRGPWD